MLVVHFFFGWMPVCFICTGLAGCLSGSGWMPVGFWQDAYFCLFITWYKDFEDNNYLFFIYFDFITRPFYLQTFTCLILIILPLMHNYE